MSRVLIQIFLVALHRRTEVDEEIFYKLIENSHNFVSDHHIFRGHNKLPDWFRCLLFKPNNSFLKIKWKGLFYEKPCVIGFVNLPIHSHPIHTPGVNLTWPYTENRAHLKKLIYKKAIVIKRSCKKATAFKKAARFF